MPCMLINVSLQTTHSSPFTRIFMLQWSKQVIRLCCSKTCMSRTMNTYHIHIGYWGSGQWPLSSRLYVLSLSWHGLIHASKHPVRSWILASKSSQKTWTTLLESIFQNSFSYKNMVDLALLLKQFCQSSEIHATIMYSMHPQLAYSR